MPINSRALRQFGNSNRLENLGNDRLDGFGDHFAAFRASVHGVTSASQPAMAVAVDTGPFVAMTTNAASLGMTGGTLAVEHVIDTAAAGSSVIGSAILVASDAHFGDNGYELSAANLAAVGADTNVAHWGRLQMGLAEIFIEAQMGVSGMAGQARDAALAVFSSANGGAKIFNGMVAIDAVANDGNGAALLAQMQALGLQYGASYGAMAGGYIPIDALDELANLGQLGLARPSYTMENVGLVTGQHVTSMNVDYVQSTFGAAANGSGIRIGVISNSFDFRTTATTHYAQDVANGDLPAGVHILAESPTASTDEGRAMAQAIYDIAPGAAISFYTANPTQAAFATGIGALKADGARIIVDDVIYFAEPMFQDGIIAQAVGAATAGAGGAMYFSSAGNQATSSYESAFRHSGQLVNVGGVFYELHDFDPGAGIDFQQSITKSGTVTYVLNWANPSLSTGGVGATSDLALFLFTSSGIQVANTANVGFDAIEIAQNSTAYIGIGIGIRVGDVDPAAIKYVTYGTLTENEFRTNSGTATGHANAESAISVGASDWVDSSRFGTFPVGVNPFPYGEAFTSRGNVPIYFDSAGNAYAAPQWRSSVDFTASDGGNNSFFGSDVTYDADTFPNFYGTSQAAPNAAAVASLLMQYFPTATNAQIYAALKQSAIDINILYTGTVTGVGYDPDTGWGLIQADRAFAILAETMQLGNAVLSPGQAQIISVSTEDTIPGGAVANDGISFMLLAPLAAGAKLYITDRNWNGTVFTNAAGEGTFTYTAGADLPAGTVVHISQAQLTTAGMALSDLGETIYLYQGSTPDVPTVFLHAVDIADGTAGFDGNELLNTGLVNGTTAVSLSDDNAEFGGRTHNIQTSDLVTSINDATNWVHNDNSPQDGTATGTPAFTAPDAQIWVAGSGAGEALVTINLDATYNAGTIGYQIVQAFQNDANLFHPSDITLDTVDGKAFFIDSDISGGHNRVIQVNISDLLNNPGSALPFTVLYQDTGITSASSMRTLSVDTQNNIIYFDHGTTFNKIVYNTALQTPTVLANLTAQTPSTNNFITQVTIDYEHGQVLLGSSRVTSVFGQDVVSRNYVYTATGLTPASATLTFTQLPFNPDDNDPGAPNDPDIPPVSGEGWPAERGTIRGIDIDPVTRIAYIVTGSVSLDTSTAQDGSQIVTFPGGIYTYALTGNPNGDVTTLFTQNGATGPLGLMYYIEVDHATGKYYVIDETGTNANPGDGAVYVGTLGNVAAPTLLATVANFNGLGPQGLEIQHASTLAGTGLAATFVETPGNPSPNGTAVTLANAFSAHDADSEGDINADELAGAQVRISGNFQSGAGHADQLLVSSFNTGTNQNGTIVIGADTVTFSYNAALGVMTFTGITTLDNYENILGRLQFRSDGDNPTNYGAALNRTVSFSTFDGLLYSDEVNVTVNVTGANDAPINVVGGTTAATEDASIAVAGISVSDVDANPATQDITVTLAVTHGTLAVFTNVGGGVQLSDVTGNGTATVIITATQNEINATLAAANGLTYTPTLDYNGSATLTVTTNDNGFNGTGGALSDVDVKSITIAAVNDAPVVSGDGTEDSATILEDTPGPGQLVSTLFSGQYSDQKDNQIPNGGASSPGAFSGIAVVANAATAGTGNWQYFSGGVWTNIPTGASLSAATLIGSGTLIRFNPALNYNGAEPLLTVRLIDNSLGFGITDGQVVNISAFGATGGTTAYSATAVTLSGSITAVNDAPTSTALSGDSATWTEGGAAALLDVGSNVTLADVDSANFDTGSLTVHIGAGLVAAEDQLGIVNQGNAAGQIGVGAGTVSFGGTQFATFTGGGAGGADLVFTFDPDATQAAVQALMRVINYSNSGGDNPTAGSRAIAWTLVDGDGIANSGADTLVVNSSVNVVAVNDAPSGTDHTASFNEDSTYTFAAADFGFTDVDGNSFSGVRFTTLPLLGTIFLDTDGAGGAAPVAISAGDIVALSEIQAGHVYYVPVANGNGTNYANFMFQVRDNGGTTGGGVDLDQSPNLFTFDVASVNDAPTSINLSGNTAIWTEGSSPVLLDVGSNGTISDIDSADFDTGTLTVHIINPVAAQDQLGIVNQGNGAGQIGVGAGTVSFGGVQFATFTGGGAGGADLVFTFDPDATPAAVQALVHAINYTNSGGISPTAGVRNISWTLVDGDGITNGGHDTLTLFSAVAVQAINDAPTGTDDTITINEDATFVLTAGTFGFGDVNGDLFAGVVVTTVPVPGTLLYDADGVGGAAAVAVTAGQFISASEIALGHLYYSPIADGNGVPFSSFMFQVRDDGGTGNGGVDTDQSPNTLTFNVTALNDAPVNVVPGTQSINEEGNFTLSTGNGNAISVSDVDATLLTVTLTVAHGTLTLASTAGLSFLGGSDGTADVTMSFSGTQAAINAALGAGLTYNADGNYHGSDALSVVTDDGGQTGAGGSQMDSDSITINIASVNDAPSGADNTVTGSEDDPYVFTAAEFGFTDPNDGDAFLAVIIDTFPANGTLFLDTDGPGGAAPIDLSTLGPGVFVGVDQINLGHFYFQPDADEFGTGYAQFTFRVQDDGGMLNGGVDRDPIANTITIDIQPDNLAPVFDLDTGTGGVNTTLGYTENDAATVIAPSATLTDDSTDFDTGSLTVSFTANGTADDNLAIRNQGNGAGQIGVSGANVTYQGVVIGTFTGGTGGTNLVISFNAASTPAAADALVRNITYANGSDDPSALARTVHFAVADGHGATSTADAVINFTAVNDPGMAQPDAFLTTESAPIVAGNVFTDHGSGADTDPDNPLVVGAVNGSAGNVGVQITLASGALLTLGSNGLFDYNPNGAFDPTPTPGSGASNTPGHDSFTYTLAGGNTVTVTITLTGLDTNDLLLGTGGPDVLSGGLGNDTYVVDGADIVLESAGQGFDQVYATTSFALAAGTEVEVLSTSDWSSTLARTLYGNEYGQQIFGNAGDNYIDGGAGFDAMYGFGGNDIYVVDTTGELIFEAAGQGFDQVLTSVDLVLAAGVSAEVLSAADWSSLDNLNLTGNAFGQQIYGNAGSNFLVGGGGADSFFGFSDDDIYSVQSDDLVFEGVGGGYDQIYTDSGYALGAGQEIEVLSTNDWSATAGINLTGNEFTQQIYGNAGQNFINGGLGTDFLFGFGGDDRFVFNTALGGSNVDVIADFTTGHDQIWMDNAVFTGLSDGLLATGAFFIGTAAHDADDRIIYNNATGALLYDADGNGAGAAIQFATLSTGLTPVATDFFVI